MWMAGKALHFLVISNRCIGRRRGELPGRTRSVLGVAHFPTRAGRGPSRASGTSPPLCPQARRGTVAPGHPDPTSTAGGLRRQAPSGAARAISTGARAAGARFSGSSVSSCPNCGAAHPPGTRGCPGATAGSAPAPSSAQQAPASAPAPGAPRTTAARSLVGRVIGDKYGVIELIGQGGMGAVYEAEHLSIGRIVAVKVLHPHQAKKSEAVARLAHEARVVSSIGHPNICEIYDMGRLDDGTPYLVMERLRGSTLADRIRAEGRLDPRVVIEVAIQILSALQAAHDKGVIHRDMKPENIFLSSRPGLAPIAKLLDFGVSKAENVEDSRLKMTRTGMVVGTPYYMAPEQALGDRPLDHRVDIWGVGMVLYESLAGRRPFEGKNYNALLARIVTNPHVSLLEVRPDLPRALGPIVDRALSKNRDGRFGSAREFQSALADFRRRDAGTSSARGRWPDGKSAASSASGWPPAGAPTEEVAAATRTSVDELSLDVDVELNEAAAEPAHHAPVAGRRVVGGQAVAPLPPAVGGSLGADDDDWDVRTRVRPQNAPFAPLPLIRPRIVDDPTIDVTSEAEVLSSVDALANVRAQLAARGAPVQWVRPNDELPEDDFEATIVDSPQFTWSESGSVVGVGASAKVGGSSEVDVERGGPPPSTPRKAP